MENKKSRAVYIVLAIFLGDFGIHQFYLKNYIRGLLYLSLCWTFIPILISIYDILTINKQFMKLEEKLNDKNNINNSLYSLNYFEKEDKFYNEENIILEKYKDLNTPDNIKDFISNMKNMNKDKVEVFFKIIGQNENFIETSLRYANERGVKSTFVPLKTYWPTFNQLNYNQKSWYFYWRGCVLNGNYIDTDLSYIFLFIYELINYSFNDNAAFNVSMMERLYQAYKDRESKLESYIKPWINDFLYEVGKGKIDTSKYFVDNRFYNKLKENDSCIEKVSITTWKQFIYGYTETKFFKSNKNKIYKQFKMNMKILYDFYKQNGTSIYKQWFDEVKENREIYLYSSAVVERMIEPVVLTEIIHKPKEKIYDEITQIFRLSENIAREDMGEKRRIIVKFEYIPNGFIQYLNNTLEFMKNNDDIKSRFKKVKENGIYIGEPIPKKTTQTKIKLTFDDEKIKEISKKGEDLIELFNDEDEESINGIQKVNTGDEKFIKSLSELEKIFICKLGEMELQTDKLMESSGKNDIGDLILTYNINTKAEEFLSNVFIKLEGDKYSICDEYKYIYEEIKSTSNYIENKANKENKIDDENVSKISLEVEEIENTSKVTELGEDIEEDEESYIKSLSEIEKNIIVKFKDLKLDIKSVKEFSRENNTMPSVLIDSINEKAEEFLGDTFINLDNDKYFIYEEYEYIYVKIKDQSNNMNNIEEIKEQPNNTQRIENTTNKINADSKTNENVALKMEDVSKVTEIYNDLEEDEEGYIKSLSKIEKNIIIKFKDLKLDSKSIKEYSRENNTMPSVLIDSINEKAEEFLGDTFINLDSDMYCIYEEYADIVDKIKEGE